MKKHKTLLRRAMFLFVALLLVNVAWAQTRNISGTVKDGNGEPIIGASVVVTGTSTGTVTDLSGTFRLDIPTSAKSLEVSYVGMEKKSVVIAGSVIHVILQDESRNLDELIVVGYGVVKKSDLTGSVTSIKSDEITKTTTSNAMQAMQARVPGLDIQQSSGQAGAGINVTLRGNRSISASNSPLILLDGIEYGSNIDINPSDIESMEVLKDASSTAIYGTRGANGVILITTKRGKAGKTNVSFNSYMTINTPTNVPRVMYGDREVQRLIDKANYQADKLSGNWGTSNLTPELVLTEKLEDFTEIGIYNDKSYTNWLDMILQTGNTQNYEVSVSGGKENTNFNLSLGSMLEEGLMRNDQQARYNLKTNLDHRINKYLKTGASLLFTYKDRDARNSSVFGQSMKMTTITHPYKADGTIIDTPNPRYAAHVNPLMDESEGVYVDNTVSTRFFGNGYLQIEPIKNMVIKSVYALDRSNTRIGNYQDYLSVARYQSPGTSSMSMGNEAQTNYTWENTVNYNTNFDNSEHEITGLLGQSMDQNLFESMSAFGDVGKEHYYTSLFYDLSKIATPKTKTEYIKSNMMSYFGRVNYKFAERYLLTASLRADGSSTLSEGNKWGYFPSAALAWRINEESFMLEQDWLDNLKLRTSWGISGNAAVLPYATMTTLSTTPVYYNFGSTVVAGNLPSNLGNSELKWETTTSTNIGLDFGFLDNRISGSIDYYINNTDDLLYRKSAPLSSVYPSVLANIGATKGNGLEVQVNTLIAKNSDFSWDINWSYSTSTDEIVKLSDGVDKNINGVEGQIVGQPVSIYYDFQSDGTWDVGEFAAYKEAWLANHTGSTLGFLSSYGEPGTMKLVDLNDDGKLTDDDKIVYNRSPKHIFGMNNSVSYKDLSLSVLVFARLGGYISYDMNSQLNYESANWGELDYWTPTNVDAKFPSPGAASATFSSYGTALKYESADFIKIKEINLSYNLPSKVVKNLGISRLKVFGSLKNYFTFSKIDNYDPERGGSISFPLAKQMVFGLNLEL